MDQKRVTLAQLLSMTMGPWMESEATAEDGGGAHEDPAAAEGEEDGAGGGRAGSGSGIRQSHWADRPPTS